MTRLPRLCSGIAGAAACTLFLAAAAPAAPAEIAAPQDDLADLAGCYAGEHASWLRTQVAAGNPPLLVINDEPAGLLRYDADRCARLPWRELRVLEVRLLRGAAAVPIFGATAAEGAVIMDVDVGQRPRPRPRLR